MMYSTKTQVHVYRRKVHELNKTRQSLPANHEMLLLEAWIKNFKEKQRHPQYAGAEDVDVSGDGGKKSLTLIALSESFSPSMSVLISSAVDSPPFMRIT